MKHFFALAAAPLLLAACTPRTTVTLQDHLLNPLFAERYAEAMVDRMTELEIQNDPILQDENKKSIAEQNRDHWLSVARAARQTKRTGLLGEFVGDKEYIRGQVLLLNNILYLGPGFDTEPGPELHIFITKAVDPRDAAFPDATAIDLGILQSPYGAQQYQVESDQDLGQYRSVVLFDVKMERLYGFAQLYAS